jgi:hypothetical protein
MGSRDTIDIDKVNISKIIIKYRYRYNNEDIIDDVSYCGELNKNNKPSGYGVGIFNTFKYCGLWENGEPNGEGIKYFSQNGNRDEIKYIGKFRGLSTLGNIAIYLNNKLYYSGNMINNHYTGTGKTYYRNGKIKYEGNFKNSLRDGIGQFNDENGNIIFIGNYKENKRFGQGKLYDITFNNLIPKYNGEWLDNKYNGNGTLYYTISSYYIGQFVDNKKDGYGKLYLTTSLYEGNFKNDKKNGNGKFTIFAGKANRISIVYEGNFNDDILEGYVKCKYKNGDTYEGNIKNYDKEGFGIYICSKTNIKYEGEWKNDLKDGNIVMTDDNGHIYKTIWKKGKQITNKRYETEFTEEEKPIKKMRKDIPIEYKCPISLFIMKNPVIASDGNTYELSSLESLFKGNESATSPLTREILNRNVLIPNKNIKKLIDDLLIENPLVLQM